MRNKIGILWSDTIGNHDLAIFRLISGKYLAATGLRQSLGCRWADRDEVFDTVQEAFRFVGWPVGVLPIPIKEK